MCNLYAALMEEKAPGVSVRVQFKDVLLEMELAECRVKMQNFVPDAIGSQWMIV